MSEDGRCEEVRSLKLAILDNDKLADFSLCWFHPIHQRHKLIHTMNSRDLLIDSFRAALTAADPLLLVPQQLPDSDRCRGRALEPRNVARKRLIKIDPPGLDFLHHEHGDNLLGHRCPAPQLGIRRLVGRLPGAAIERPSIDRLTIRNPNGAGKVGGLEQRVDRC